jgi:hypothetical protein
VCRDADVGQTKNIHAKSKKIQLKRQEKEENQEKTVQPDLDKWRKNPIISKAKKAKSPGIRNERRKYKLVVRQVSSRPT